MAWPGGLRYRATRAPRSPLAALWPSFGLVEASGTLIFYIYFWDFLAYLNIQKPGHNKTTLLALLKTTSVRVTFVQIMQE